MIQTLVSASAISLITAALAAAIVFAGKFIRNYGDCRITINSDKELMVTGGQSLLEALRNSDIFIPSACGGKGTCGYCKVKVLEGGGPLLPTEEPYLDEKERAAGTRLSCQIKVRDNIDIRIPDELFSIRSFEAVCERIRDLTHDIKEFRFRLTEPKEISYTPGQYIQLFTPIYDNNEEVYRAYSISSDPAEKNIVELVVRLVPGGICTTYLFNHLTENDPVSFNGPYGEMHLSDTDAPMIFVAGGSGMAPIKCMLHEMKNRNIQRPATYFFGSNRVDELFYREEMKQFENDLHEFSFVPVVANPETEWSGETGLVTQPFSKLDRDLSGHEAYLCGSPGMIDAVVKTLTGMGIEEKNIFYDKFA